MSSSHSCPIGFQFSGVACGLKANPETLDLALFVSDRDCAAAGVFTTNRVCGAPVKISRSRVPNEGIRAVVINSGNANTSTGDQGDRDALSMTDHVSAVLECPSESVLICSTGVIGRHLPGMDIIHKGINSVAGQISSEEESLVLAAKAMMTTDTHHKIASRKIELAGTEVTITGVAKGAAMIAPNMATMLSIIMTDANFSDSTADRLLRDAVDQSFNCISVDGHTSTSDTVLLLANGAAVDEPLSLPDTEIFHAALNEITLELAQMIIRDAEGAEHFVTVEVTGLSSRDKAHEIAKTVAEDVLVKTAITGNDPNWGRIVSACGRTSVKLTEKDITLSINNHFIFKDGAPTNYEEALVSEAMKTGEVLIKIEFSFGNEGVRIWTSDLTQEYVRLNSEYTT